MTGNREYNPGWHTAMDLHNLLTVSEAVTRAAILRKESRGAQFRDDYPKKDNAKFGKVNTIICAGRRTASMQIRLEPIPPMPEELKEAIKAEARREAAGRIDSHEPLGRVATVTTSNRWAMRTED